MIYQSNSHSLKLDPDNFVMIAIDAATKIACIRIKSFRFTERQDDVWWGLRGSTLEMQYVENRPKSLPFQYKTKAGISFSPYIEVLDESNAIFVIGFK